MKSKVTPMNVVLLGQLLTALREDAGIKRSDAAKQVGCSLACLSKVERGESEPRLRLLSALASLYGFKLSMVVEIYEEAP